VYTKYKGPRLTRIKEAQTKHHLVRDKDVHVLHGFGNMEDARVYLKSSRFTQDVAKIKPFPEGPMSGFTTGRLVGWRVRIDRERFRAVSKEEFRGFCRSRLIGYAAPDHPQK
jgi:hypothetical protein